MTNTKQRTSAGSTKRKSFRMRFVFWLDVMREDEAAIAETIEELKEQRSFVGTIRDGIRLICDLRKGKTDVLYELFPGIVEGLQRRSDSVPVQEFQHLIQQQQQLVAQLQGQRTDIPQNSAESYDPAPAYEMAEDIASDEDVMANALAMFAAFDGGA